MRIVLLCGGSGKRLWPLSNDIRSKIFLKLLPHENGTRESMMERICRQLDAAGLLPFTSIVTHQNQVEIMKNQVGENIPIISEPLKKGTYAAVALATAYFHSVMHIPADETICVIPADLLVDSTFFKTIASLPDILSASGSDLVLLGTTPTSASNQFGYIVPTPHSEAAYAPVHRFVEKPNTRHARRLIKQGALWNCGVFAFRQSFMLAHLQHKELPVNYEEWLPLYEHLSEQGFDYEVVEKARCAAVVPYTGMWQDLGSWEAFTNHLGTAVIGPGEITKDSVHTHIVNELSQPITVLDVSNVIVAASLDGILVASKKNASRIKQLIPGVPTRPLYEEKRWGSYHVLDYSVTDTGLETLTKKITLLPGKNISYQLHHKRSEVWTITSGSGEFILEDQCFAVKTGDVIRIPRGAKHGVKALTTLECIEVQIGTKLTEEDITRIAMSWEKALQYCTRQDPSI
ncbi:sugar phosphate nucleotidyltransferase [Aneurinibacillus sp. REN35]|uniref:sugar phosphate nucleotidyltransferase n=1 Tax=Aneurinibacillus sp. REN35 TaxID=3237286 RepID=UPI003527A0EB